MAMALVDGTTRIVRLRDGRRLAYMERGRPDGFPILHHHGMPGSRLQHEAEADFYEQLGVRMITPDRPGYGLSDPHPAGRLVDWPADVLDLMDSLGVERFGVTALSGGGIYALACAAVIPNRITDVVVTGCPAPMQIKDAFRGMQLMSRAGIWLAANAPWLLEAVVGAASGFVSRHPAFTFEHFNRDAAPADRRWLAMPSVAGGAIDDIREGLRNGAGGYARDLELLARPWGFALEDIRVPVDLWHGDADHVIPPRHAQYLASVIPGARLHMCPGEAHLLLWNHLPEVLLAAAGVPAAFGLAAQGPTTLAAQPPVFETRAILKSEVH
jgi:pimeloyl-ACP methyl ester carboxylesterase